eukprot:3099486-Heterocapsa_arctica.AAC.1
MLAQNIGRKQLVRNVRDTARHILVITIELLTERGSLCTNYELERPILSLKHTLYRLVRNSSTDLFGTFGTLKCPEHVRKVRNNVRSQRRHMLNY